MSEELIQNHTDLPFMEENLNQIRIYTFNFKK